MAGANLPPPDTIKLDFRQSQETVFIALRARGKDNRSKNRNLVLESDNCGQMYLFSIIKNPGADLESELRYRYKTLQDIFLLPNLGLHEISQ